jgi:hypothetical protein
MIARYNFLRAHHLFQPTLAKTLIDRFSHSQVCVNQGIRPCKRQKLLLFLILRPAKNGSPEFLPISPAIPQLKIIPHLSLAAVMLPGN